MSVSAFLPSRSRSTVTHRPVYTVNRTRTLPPPQQPEYSPTSPVTNHALSFLLSPVTRWGNAGCRYDSAPTWLTQGPRYQLPFILTQLLLLLQTFKQQLLLAGGRIPPPTSTSRHPTDICKAAPAHPLYTSSSCASSPPTPASYLV